MHIQDSALMSYHTTTVKSIDFYTALREARKISTDLNKMLADNNLETKIFPYSVFYVFYEQYLTIWKDAMLSLGVSLLAIFLVTFVLTGFDIISALLVLFMDTMILINMGGLMWLWSITLNAVSVVNLVVV